jgi:hypothetical protein
MTARVPSDDSGDVRELLAELEELVDDLGLDEPAVQSRWVGDDEVELELAAAFGPELDREPAGPALLQADAEELAQLAADLAGPSRVSLWDAFAPELDAEPPRAWSPQAATAVVEPAAPEAPPAATGPSRLRRAGAVLRARMFTAATVAALLIAVAAIIFTRLDLGHTSGPASPVSHAAFAVTAMRTVDATTPTAVGSAPLRSDFPPSTTQIFMDVVYRNATGSDSLRLVITMLPGAGSGGQPISVDDQTHPLPQGGEIAVTIKGGSAGFAPGIYTVTAFHDGHLEQSLTFTVEGASPSPGVSPTAAASPAVSAGAPAATSPAVSPSASPAPVR